MMTNVGTCITTLFWYTFGLFVNVLDKLIFSKRASQKGRSDFSLKEAQKLIKPHTENHRYATTHFGVYILDLPEPLRYLNIFTLVGTAGVTAFDIDDIIRTFPDCRNVTTVHVSAAGEAGLPFLKSYDTNTECSLKQNSSKFSWGQDLTIDFNYPFANIKGNFQNLEVNFTMTFSGVLSYFTDIPALYQHITLAAHCEGTIRGPHGLTNVNNAGNFEYCRVSTPQSFFPKLLPMWAKLPLNIFTYQIIQLYEDDQDIRSGFQLLLSLAETDQFTIHSYVMYRKMQGGEQQRYRATMQIIAEEETLPLIQKGQRMPSRLRWTAKDAKGHPALDITVSPDSAWRAGFGRGANAACSYSGTWQKRKIKGSNGHIEWIRVPKE